MVSEKMLKLGPETGSSSGLPLASIVTNTCRSSCGGHSRDGREEQAAPSSVPAASIPYMSGGLAVRANLLSVTWSSARGHVFLFDLEARRPVSSWTLPTPDGGYSDAAAVAMDDRFHLFVADTRNHCVCRFSVFGRHLGTVGRAPESAGDAHRDRPGALHAPTAVAVYHDDLYVVGGDQPRRRSVQRFSREGRALGWLRSTGDPEAEFGAPRGIWVDKHGVIVADTRCSRLQVFGPADGFIASFDLNRPEGTARPVGGVRLDDGRLLVVDTGDSPGIRVLDAGGRDLPKEAAGDFAAHIEDPLALALDDHGAIYVLDAGGERVQRFSADLQFIGVVVHLAEYLDGIHGTS